MAALHHSVNYNDMVAFHYNHMATIQYCINYYNRMAALYHSMHHDDMAIFHHPINHDNMASRTSPAADSYDSESYRIEMNCLAKLRADQEQEALEMNNDFRSKMRKVQQKLADNIATQQGLTYQVQEREWLNIATLSELAELDSEWERARERMRIENERKFEEVKALFAQYR